MFEDSLRKNITPFSIAFWEIVRVFIKGESVSLASLLDIAEAKLARLEKLEEGGLQSPTQVETRRLTEMLQEISQRQADGRLGKP